MAVVIKVAKGPGEGQGIGQATFLVLQTTIDHGKRLPLGRPLVRVPLYS